MTRETDIRTIRRLAKANGATAVVAVIALIIALVSLGEQGAAIHTSRLSSARDSCHLLRGLVYAATTKAPSQRTAAAAYIARTPLRDCNVYARTIVR